MDKTLWENCPQAIVLYSKTRVSLYNVTNVMMTLLGDDVTSCLGHFGGEISLTWPIGQHHREPKNQGNPCPQLGAGITMEYMLSRAKALFVNYKLYTPKNLFDLDSITGMTLSCCKSK